METAVDRELDFQFKTTQILKLSFDDTKRLAVCLSMLWLTTACTLKNQKNGTTEYIIIGFGKVKQQEYTNARSTYSKGIGVLIKSEPAASISIGYSENNVVSIKPNTQVYINHKGPDGKPNIISKSFNNNKEETTHEINYCNISFNDNFWCYGSR